MDYNEFAEKIKAKYPDYSDMDNRTLAQKMVAKFPEYSDVTFDQPYKPSMLESTAGAINSVVDPIAGVVGKAAQAYSNAFPPAKVGGAILGAVGEGLNKAGEYVAEKGAQPGTFVNRAIATAIGGPIFGRTRTAENIAANPYVAGSAGMAVANAPMMIPVGGPAGPLPGAIPAARRSLGMGKSIMKRLPGGVERANEVASEMLNKGVISPLASSETMLSRAEALSAGSEKAMSGVMSQVGQKASIDATDVGVRALDQIEKSFGNLKGGSFDLKQRVLKEIGDTVTAAGEGPITFEKAELIKRELQNKGKFNRGALAEDAEKASLYRQASGIWRQAIDDELKSQSPELSKTYLAAKKSYGLAEDAKKGLTDQYLAELGNKAPTLRGSILAAGATGSGGLGLGALAMLASEAGIRKGSQATAYTLGKAIPSTLMAPLTRRALISQLVDRITMKDDRR